MKENLRWGVIQPLTGGMYIGAERAIGHKPEWVISYPGLTDPILDKKTGAVVDAGNEANLVQWLEKRNDMPDWYFMNRTMMQNDEDMNPIYTARDGSDKQPDLNKMDLVVAVPVCAGLSMASTASAERKAECNCQMVWMAKFALKTIKPTVYLFENAPTLMSERGDSVRAELETIAYEAGYSVVYYKTDTKMHHNCQKRPRTFIMFVKQREKGTAFVPEMLYERDIINVPDFFAEMESKVVPMDPMNVTMPNCETIVDVPVGYLQHKFTDGWRNHKDILTSRDIFDWITHDETEVASFKAWLEANYPEADNPRLHKFYNRYISHIIEKRNDNKGYWGVTAKVFSDDYLPACMYKNVPVVLHHREDRLYTMREWLFSMGHPTDFDMIGEPQNYFRKMGQNVPANTARWITSEAVRVIENYDTLPSVAKDGKNWGWFDNTKQKQIA